MARPRDEAFQAFRAANPVAELAVPGPESPKARTLFAEITSVPRHTPVRPGIPRRRLVVAIAIALLALASIAAAWYFTRDVTDPSEVVCYQQVTLASDRTSAGRGGDLDAGLCAHVWEQGILVNEDIVPSGEVPPLTACVAETGNLAVFPTDDPAVCEHLGLAVPNPGSFDEANAVRDAQLALVEHFMAQDCQPISEAEADVRRILDSHGLNEWLIVVAPPHPERPCASFGMRPEFEIVDLVPIPQMP